MKKKYISRKLSVAAKMPPLYHTLPGKNFRTEDSEVINWLVAQPEIRQYIFDKIAHDYLHYDLVSGLWSGIAYRDKGEGRN